MRFAVLEFYSLTKPVISILKPETALYLVGVPKTVIFFKSRALNI